MNDLIENSDFVSIGRGLQTNKKYLTIVKQLKDEGKYRFILDRQFEDVYLERYYYLNLRPFARLVIHRFCQSDTDGLHDHPWAFQNYILSGGYWEHTEEGRFWRPPGYSGTASLNYFHRVELDPEKADGDVWTLFLMGPKEKEWGFLNDKGIWIQHEEYLNSKLKENNNNGQKEK